MTNLCDFIFQLMITIILFKANTIKNKTEEEGETASLLVSLKGYTMNMEKNIKNRKVTDAVNAFDFKRHTFTLPSTLL